MRLPAIVLAAIIAAGIFTSSASAVTRSRAQAIANGYSAKWCPHHTLGICSKRRAYVFGPLPPPYRSGAYDITAQGWENSIFDLFPNTVTHARWFYERCALVKSNGVLSNGRWC